MAPISFDPSKPFEVVSEPKSDTPTFDPSKPFEVVKPSTWSDSAEYVGKSAVSGVKGMFGQGLGLAAGVYNSLAGLSDDEAAQLGKTAEGTAEIKRIRDASPFSKPGTAAEHASEAVVKSQNDTMASLSEGARQFDDKVYLTLNRDKAAYLSPTKVAGDILNSLPSTIVLALSARFGGTAATEARTAALARGLSEEAANKAAVEAATKVITRAGAAGEGSLGYEQQYEQTRKQVLDTPEDKLSKSPEYQELLKEGYDADKARQVLAGRAGNLAGFSAGIVDAATNLASGKVLGHVIGEGGKFLPRTAKGFATESIEEGVQSAGEQLGGNYAIQQTSDPTQDLSEGVAESAAQGAVVGGLTGAAVGAGAGQHGILNEGPKVEDFAQPDQIDRYMEHRDNEKAGLGALPDQSAAPNPKGWEINHAATPPSVANAAEAALQAAPPPSTITPAQKVSVDAVLGAQDVDSAIAAAAEAAVAGPTGAPRTSLDQMIDETKKSLDESLPNTQTKRQDAVDQLRTNLNIAAPLEVWEPNPAAPDASSVTPEFAKAARDHYSQYGVDVVFVRDSKELPFDGVVDEKQPNTIFMSSNPTRAMAQVAQHEVEHTMEEVELPDGRNLNQLLKQQVMEGLTSDAGLALELHSSTAPSRASFPSTPEGQAAHADAVLDHLYNEIGKDIGGDAPRFPAFVEKVVAAVEERYGNKTATDIFGKLVNGLRQSFNALQKFFKPSRMFESDKWVNNLDQIHDTIAKMHAAKIGEAQGLKDAAPTAENVIAEALTGKEANPTRAGPAPREGYEAAKNQATVYKRWLNELDTKRRSDADKSPEVARLRAEEKTILGKVRGGEKYLTKSARNRLEKVRAEIEARVNPKEDNEDMARVRAKMVEAHGRMADAASVTKEKKTEASAAKSTRGEPVRIGKPAPRAEETGNPTDGDRFTANQLAQDTGGKPRFSPKKEEPEKDEKPKRDHDAKITPSTIADEHEAEVAALIGDAIKGAKFSPKQTQTPEFKKWFGDSKIVDKDGKPLVVYHGTSAKEDFEAFKRRPGDIGIHFGTLGQAEDRWSYLRGRRDVPDDTAPRVIPVYLSIKNPFRMEDAGLWNGDNMDHQFQDAFPNNLDQIRRLKTPKDYREFLQRRGYDGVVYRNTGEVSGGAEYQARMDAAHEAMVASQRARGKSVSAYDHEDQQTAEYKAHDEAYRAAAAHRENNAEDSYIAFEREQIKSAVGNSGAFNPKDPRIQFSPKVEEKGPVFFSALERAVDGVKFEKAPPGQWLATIKNMPGIKAEEIQTTRIDKWLNAQTGPVTKAQVLEQLELGSVKVKEVTKGEDYTRQELDDRAEENFGMAFEHLNQRDRADVVASLGAPKFSTYVLPGGENYRELLMTLPKNEAAAKARHEAAKARMAATRTDDPSYLDRMREVSATGVTAMNPRSGEFKSSHWNEPNVLAHMRFDTRTGPNGEKILHIAEIQSDWHQKGRKEGYADPSKVDELIKAGRKATDDMYATRERMIKEATDGKYTSKTEARDAGDMEGFKKIVAVDAQPEMLAAVARHENAVEDLRRARGGVPDAPFKTTWHELAMKRMLRYAAENGYDRVSWDTGETNAERFDLSKSVSRIDWYKSATGKVHLEVFGLDGGIIHAGAHTLQELPNVIGKDLADKIAERMASPYTKEGSFEGEGLKVGGEGMRGFYDKILPAFVSKYVKKWGAKVERSSVPTPSGEQRKSTWMIEHGDVADPNNDGRVLVVNRETGQQFGRMEYDRAHAFIEEQNRANTADRTAPVHSVEITPEMRRAVLQGQPKFSPKAKPTAKELTKEVPGLKKVVSNLTSDEIKDVSARTADRLVKLFTTLPESEEAAAVAYSGRAKRGWYKHSAQAIVDVFGQQDGSRFAALLAALSPQTSVESNLENALKMWVNWNKAGRPQDTKAIGKLLGQSVQGSGGEASVLDAWRGNSIRALTDADPGRPDFMLSGPKVNSFAKNLRNEVNEVTNDAWMATYAAIEPEMLASRRLINKRDNVGKSFGFKSDGYVAMSAMVRDAAKILTRRTGQTWTPAEVQETVWSWAKTLYERRDRAGEYRTAQQILKAADMTHEDVTSTPDFAVLLTRGLYRKILEGGNYGAAVDALEKSRGGDASVGRPSGPSVSVTGAEGSGFAQSAFERHLQRAAARLERVRTDRLTAKGINPRELIADARDSEIAANMSAATNSIPGIAQLAAAANAGDESAARMVNLIAHESLERLIATVPDAQLEVSRNGGLYGGSLEPSLGVKITFPEKRRAGVLAALAKFAGNFNQEQIHVRQPTIDPAGRVYTDGSYATPVYTFELEAPLSRSEIEQVIADSGLYGLNFSDKKLEAYYVGDPRDEAARAEFGAAIERARDSLGERARSAGRSTARLWAYGIGDSATQGYDAITGDVPRGTSEHTEVPRALAERDLGHEVETSDQADEITEAQRLLQSKIADHYEQLPDNDMANPDVRRAYEELSKEIQKQFAALPVKVDVWNKPGEPYKSSTDMRRDVLDNNHMWIFGTTSDTFGPPGADFHNHPLLQLTGRVSDNGFPLVVNDELRAVHDYYAHMLSPATFGPRGEETAWKNHLATIDNPWARWALTSETRGQNSWVNFGAHVEPGSKLADRPFARQKAALLPMEHMLTGNDAIDGPTYEFMRTHDYGTNGSLPREVNDPFADFSPRVPSALREKLIRQDPAYKAMFAEPKKQLAIGKLPEAPTPKVVELPPPSDKEPRRKALQPIDGTGDDRFRAINGALYSVGEEQPQMDRAARLVEDNPEKALRIAMLEERAPAGVHPEFVFMALEEAAMLSQDIALQERLSHSRIAEEATTMGQRIAAWRNRATLSPVDDMRKIREARVAKAKARGIDPEAKIDEVVKQAQAFTRRTAKSNKRPSLNDFIMGIVCKT